LDNISLKLCDIQGRLFELSSKKEFDSKKFTALFMKSDVAKALDSKYNRMQWAGEEYLLEELTDGKEEFLSQKSEIISSEIMYWIGFLYRYWHFYKNECSIKIYRNCSFDTLKRNYAVFHTMDAEMAIDDLIEIKKQKKQS